MKKFALVASACVALFAVPAYSQQFDVAVGGNTLLQSYKNNSSSQAFTPLAEKGGTYISVSGDVVGFRHRRLGLNIETSWRARQGSYYGYEHYRPILTDFNALYQPRLSKKIGLDLMGGIGFSSTRFYVSAPTNCSYFTGCINYVSSDHFMEHVGGGIRYYFWHHVFVRPEIHYYRIQNNVEFNSDNVIRVGGSLGLTIGPD